MNFAEAMKIADQNQGHPVSHEDACAALSVLRVAALSLDAPEWFDCDLATKALARQYGEHPQMPRAEVEKLAIKFGHDPEEAFKRYAPWMAA